jgi:hypothetical protein
MDKIRSFLDYLSQNQELAVFVGILAIFLLILFLLFVRLLFVSDYDSLRSRREDSGDENLDLRSFLQQLKEVSQQTRLSLVQIEQEVEAADVILIDKYKEIEKLEANLQLLKSDIKDFENINPKLIQIAKWRLFFIGLLIGTLLTASALLTYYWLAIQQTA